MQYSALIVCFLLAPFSEGFPNIAKRVEIERGLRATGASTSSKRQLGSGKYTRIENTGTHAFIPPGPNDIRGPCAGLNALANHGYISRDGVTNVLEAGLAVDQVYGMAQDLGTVLSVIAAVYNGDPLTEKWSIGGSSPKTAALGDLSNLLFGDETGLNGHGKYEGDTSLTRGDYYTTNGDDHTPQLSSFLALKSIADANGGKYNFDTLSQHKKERFDYSVANNDRFFYPYFSGLLVSTAAYSFLPHLFANFSDAYPEGDPNESVIGSFLGVQYAADGTPNGFGAERIPDNFYRNPGVWGLVDAVGFIYQVGQKYPETLSIGGNTNGVNTFSGVDLGNVTGGLFNSEQLFASPNDLGCFIYLLMQSESPFILGGIFGDITAALNLLTSKVFPIFASAFNCPDVTNATEIAKNYQAAIAKFPGAAVPSK